MTARDATFAVAGWQAAMFFWLLGQLLFSFLDERKRRKARRVRAAQTKTP